MSKPTVGVVAWTGLLVYLGLCLGVVGWGCGGEGPDAREGRKLFRSNCAQCHGTDARGKSGVAAGLVGNPTLASSTDEQLMELIRGGLRATDPRNGTGIPMPPRGSHRDLTDGEIAKVVSYLRSLG